MTLFTVVLMLAGMGALLFLPLNKKRHIRIATQALGAVLFGSGLVGFIYEIFVPAI